MFSWGLAANVCLAIGRICSTVSLRSALYVLMHRITRALPTDIRRLLFGNAVIVVFVQATLTLFLQKHDLSKSSSSVLTSHKIQNTIQARRSWQPYFLARPHDKLSHPHYLSFLHKANRFACHRLVLMMWDAPPFSLGFPPFIHL